MSVHHIIPMSNTACCPCRVQTNNRVVMTSKSPCAFIIGGQQGPPLPLVAEGHPPGKKYGLGRSVTLSPIAARILNLSTHRNVSQAAACLESIHCINISRSETVTSLDCLVEDQRPTILSVHSSVAVLAEILLRSPRKIFIFNIKKIIYRIKVSKNK